MSNVIGGEASFKQIGRRCTPSRCRGRLRARGLPCGERVVSRVRSRLYPLAILTIIFIDDTA